MADARDPGGLHRPQDGIGADGQLVPGPPWILGYRGVPLEAPENTLAGMLHAVELGLAGFAYDLRASATRELVLLADPTLDRTTDGTGPLAARTLPELSRLDAGGWFAKRFAGEPLALVEEVLSVEGNHAGAWPQHLIELREPALLPLLARALEGRGEHLSVRIASPHRAVCAEARDLGLQSLLICRAAGPEQLAAVRDEGLAACATWPGGWRDAPPAEQWNAERWSLGVDRPDDLLEACRLPLNGFHTNTPRRALAARALTFLAPDDRGDWPVRVPALEMTPGARLEGPGEWCGHWRIAASVRNPFPFAVRAQLELVVGRGAFEARGLPPARTLTAGEQLDFEFELAGGSWQPGGDPVLAARFAWRPGPGRPEEQLTLDAPLDRVRTLRVGPGTQRVELLRERRGQPRATVTARLRGRDLLLAVEDAGGLEDARVVCALDGVQDIGTAGLRVVLPRDFATREGGVPFSVGLLGRNPSSASWSWRRWAGGLPVDLRSGPPGRLQPDGRA